MNMQGSGKQWKVDLGVRTLVAALVILAHGQALMAPRSHVLQALNDTGGVITKRDDAPSTKPTVKQCLQVAQPVLGPEGMVASDGSAPAPIDRGSASQTACVKVLMVNSFQNSYDKPFVGQYTPPTCEFNRVIMNFTVTAVGRQFDRLALMFLGDAEVWRTSTAEPSEKLDIRWTYIKDMTAMLSLWKSPQSLTFDLGNLVDNNYTAAYNATLTATFFNSTVQTDAGPPSDLIIPISKVDSANQVPSQFSLPQDRATSVIRNFPQNARRAVFSVSACGQATEEFWWGNVLQSDIFTFNATVGEMTGYSPFREVQVLIDGQLAGVQWPYPVIFTGGIDPHLHRPVVGIDSFDLKEHEMDITPFLPVLCDGNQHTFTILVAGLNDHDGTSATLTQTVDPSWYVTGKIFVWLDPAGSITTGDLPTIQNDAPTLSVSHRLTQFADGTNNTLDYTTNVNRSISIQGHIVTQKGPSNVSWTQQLTYSNVGSVMSAGNSSKNKFNIQGTDMAHGSSSSPYQATYRYPLFVNITVMITPDNNRTMWTQIHQGKQQVVSGPAVFPTGLEAFASLGTEYTAATLSTTQQAVSSYFLPGDNNMNATRHHFTTDQDFTFCGAMSATGQGETQLYYRKVMANNDSVTFNYEVVAGA